MNSPVGKLPPPTSILINDAKFVLTEKGTLTNKSVYVRERSIADIGDSKELLRKYGPPERTLDASSCLVMPGLVNNHSHIAMTLLRGFAEDLPLLNWLQDKVWAAEAKLTPEDIYIGALIGCVESLLSGTTSLTSSYFYDESGSEAQAVAESGLRGLLAHGVFDWTRRDAFERTEGLVKRWHGYDDGRVRAATSPHAPYSCSPDFLKELEYFRSEFNEKHGQDYRIMNTLHVSEARTEIEEIQRKYNVDASHGVANYLDSLGVLNSETICAHSIHLTDEDFASMKKTGASIASCPISNLKVGMGIADIPKAIATGVTVSLGTDGPASNNSLDMFETMKMASLLQKGVHGNTTLMKAQDTFEIATLGGARSMHQEKDIGTLSKGKKADIAIIDLSGIHSSPLYEPYSHLVFSARSSDVRDVIVDGRLLVKNRENLHIDLESLKRLAMKAIERLGLTFA